MKTETRAKVLRYIESHLEENQIPPTMREIQEHFGFKAIGTVQYHLKQLAETGFLAIKPRLSRGLSLTKQTTGIPILGTVPAGPAQLAFEDIEAFLPHAVADLEKKSVDTAPSKGTTPPIHQDNRGYFALRVKGDSMIEAGIMESDLVVVRPQSSAKNGDIVVARINQDEATVKRLVRKPGLIQLAPANPRHKPIPVDENVHILGKVVRVIRHYA